MWIWGPGPIFNPSPQRGGSYKHFHSAPLRFAGSVPASAAGVKAFSDFPCGGAEASGEVEVEWLRSPGGGGSYKPPFCLAARRGGSYVSHFPGPETSVNQRLFGTRFLWCAACQNDCSAPRFGHQISGFLLFDQNRKSACKQMVWEPIL